MPVSRMPDVPPCYCAPMLPARIFPGSDFMLAILVHNMRQVEKRAVEE